MGPVSRPAVRVQLRAGLHQRHRIRDGFVRRARRPGSLIRYSRNMEPDVRPVSPGILCSSRMHLYEQQIDRPEAHEACTTDFSVSFKTKWIHSF